MGVEIEVPSHFLCPISMQLMRDPVTISTGITYDRVSIERWLFTCLSRICPMTKQPLYDTDLTPNHTLRRLIQSWCIMNSHHGFDRIPTPKKPVDKSQILKLLQDAKKHPQNQIKCLRRMRSIAQSSDRNKTCMEDSGAVEFLTTVVLNEDGSDACNEALIVLHHLKFTDLQMRKLVKDNELGFVDALLRVMRCGSIQSRSHAIMLIRSLLEVADPVHMAAIKPDLFQETVRVLKDGISPQTTKASLELVVDILRWGRNRIKAAESGMVSVLVELLIDTCDRRGCELMLVALEQICRCAEGRAKLVEHAAGLATVSKKILRVSHMASDKAVRIVCLVCRFSASCRVVQEMVEVGVVSKLCLMIQVDCSERTKERVKQILGLHSRVWKGASCIPAHLLSSYPSLQDIKDH
ncbi:E3 ubiquitin-protein ligase PUB23-like [Cynara cardunculus var. scolymus]|nr:E3 ubiquitin-protein ligase PUB23-like [Cynara cardunculus var. scolymus]XP_024995854.1 E3 ubiquitin-protein ligase PUB23-like [Cynara cardunculus var. scolymus]